MIEYASPTEGVTTPRPAICPNCGLTADNGITRRSELTATATFCCTNGHLFSVTWLEVA